MRYLPFAAVVGVLALTAAETAAQSVGRDPTYGSVSLNAGFLPDPHVTRLTAGGGTEVNRGSCSYGYVADAPDVDVYYSTGGRTDLYFYVESDNDVTLLINTPDGRWLCNDDGHGNLDPLVEIPNARDGLYNVWVGTYGSSTAAATLFVSEINPSGGGGGGARPQTPSRGQPDYTRRPSFDTAYLDAGFLPDPWVADLTAGGPIDVEIPGVCSTGWVATAPDVDLQYSTRGRTGLYIYAEAPGDITLLINTPDGRWLCNDDGHGNLDPLIEIPNARDGLYNIWVGTYGEDNQDATLFISEIHPDDASARSAPSSRGAPDLSLSPTYGTIRLDQGFLPDPYIEGLEAGGNIDVDIPNVCSTGYVANAPDFNLQYSARSSGKGRGGGGASLYVYAEASSDITLLINMPDGRWVCDDDGWEGLNPLVAMPRAEGGLYNIWVGTYGSSNVNATLYITEIDPR